jgi:hypothetical protein
MADPKQKSLQPPVLWRIPTIWQIPQWQQALQWRWFVYNQPIAMLCRSRLINYLLGLPWEIVSKNPDEEEALKEDIHYYTNWVLSQFDLVVDKLWQDALDLPIGGNIEIMRWPAGVKPVIQVGSETYKVTREHPKGHPFKLVNIDGATLFPTYELDLPLAQRIAEESTPVYFRPDEIGRVGIQPRTEMRLNGYFRPPPEQVYLAIVMVNHGDHYYSDLLKNVPPVGILDLMDMSSQSATDGIGSVRSLFEGDDPFKIPVLYEHEKVAQFIPFGKSPQELLFDSASLRYARTTCASYGLTLGNLGLEPKGETLAGSIRDDMQAATGYGFVTEKTKGLIDGEILPPYLEWQPKIQDNEKLSAFLVFAQALKVTKEASAMKPSEVQAQLKREGFITIEVEKPDDEAAMTPPVPFGQPQINSKQKAEEIAEKVPPAQGGRGEITGKADVEQAKIPLADVTKADVSPLMHGSIAKAFAQIQAKATDARLRKLAKAVTRIVFDTIQKAELDNDELDRIIDVEKWYLLPDAPPGLAEAYAAAFSEGARQAAIEVLQALELDTAIDFTLTNPRTLAMLEDKAALLVSRVNDGTKYYLKRMLVDGVEKGLSSPDIATLIKEGASVDDILKQGNFLDDVVKTVKAELEKMSRERVESIVNTEINRAESEGRLNQWREMGLTKKMWKTAEFADVCPICRGNEAKGFVGMDYLFDDVFEGTLTPPGHPHMCRCHLEFSETELLEKSGSLRVWTGD